MCLGFFDGVHLAHQKLMDKTIELAKESHLCSSMMTFSEYIMAHIRKERFYFLSSLQDKINKAEEKGFDYFYVLEVSQELINLPAPLFIDKFLAPQSKIVVGFDFTFGQFGKGNVELLRTYQSFETIVLNEMIYHEEKIGSTKIRECLKQGKLAEANYLLGSPYFIQGEVIHGKSRGKDLGFPTANILNPGYLSLHSGVYIGKIEIDGESFYGLINIGNNPTFDDAFESIEAYIFDFNRQIYGKHIKVSFLYYIRDEIKFNSVDELIDKMHEDETIGRAFIKEGGYL